MSLPFSLQLILNAKCHAIRDAQILEKQQIKHELHTEEQRLDAMMEADRVNAIAVAEEIAERRKHDSMIGAMKVMEQIRENEQVSERASEQTWWLSEWCSRV